MSSRPAHFTQRIPGQGCIVQGCLKEEEEEEENKEEEKEKEEGEEEEEEENGVH